MPEQPQVITAHHSFSLLEELTSAYNQARTMRFIASELMLPDALQSDDPYVSAMAATQLHELVAKLSELVVNDSRFPGDSVRMVRSDVGGSGFYPNFVGVPLLRRALQTGRPEEAIEWLQKVLGTSVAFGKTIHALWGIPVEREIQFTQDVKIVPIEELPDSIQKQWITGCLYFRSGSPVATMLDFTPPKSALIVRRRIDPFTCDPGIQPVFANDEFLETDELLKNITLVLTVVGPRVAISAAQWFTFDDPDLEQACILSGQRRSQFHEILPNRHDDYPLLDSTEAQEIVQAYIALHGDTRRKVRVALQRLSQALRRHSTGDRAVELSTAFETLLGDNDKTELTHKIKVRSARLIGGVNEVRKKNAAIINAAYSIRSKLVHTGVDDARSRTICGECMSATEIIDQTVRICTDLIKIIIRRGSIPDWSIFDIIEHT